MIWLGAGGVIFAAGLFVLFGLRQGYERPRNLQRGYATDAPPDALPPALAGALALRGRPSLEQAAATLLVLAERGVLRVEENERRTLGTRTFHLTRAGSRSDLSRHEEAVLAAVFGGEATASVTLAKARARLTRRFGRFGQAVMADLGSAGLLDSDRQQVRRAQVRLMTIEFVLALAAFGAWPFLMDSYGRLPLSIFGGFAAAGIVALVACGMTTPLTNEGVQRGLQWRAYRDYLKKISRRKEGAPPTVSLAYPVALGLAGAWATHLKRYPVEMPPWFRSSDGPPAYAAFIAAAGAGAHGNSPPHHAH